MVLAASPYTVGRPSGLLTFSLFMECYFFVNIELCYCLHMIVCRNIVSGSRHRESVGRLGELSCREALFLLLSVQMARMLVWDY